MHTYGKRSYRDEYCTSPKLHAISTHTSPICTTLVFRQFVRVLLFVYIASSNTSHANIVKCSNSRPTLSQERYVIILMLINRQNFNNQKYNHFNDKYGN